MGLRRRRTPLSVVSVLAASALLALAVDLSAGPASSELSNLVSSIGVSLEARDGPHPVASQTRPRTPPGWGAVRHQAKDGSRGSTLPLPGEASDERRLSLFAAAPGARVAEAIIVAPYGSASGQGTVDSPLDLATALSDGGPVRAGDLVLLKGGVYPGTYASRLEGTADRPITVASYPGEWAIIDAGTVRRAALTILGAHTLFRDLEVMRSDTDRVSRQSGSTPSDISRGGGDGIHVHGESIKLINLIVHDNGNGIILYENALGAEVHGNLIFNNGWIGPDRGHGHGIYVQNRSGLKRIVNTVIFNNFGWGIHGYGNKREVSGVSVVGVTSFENGAPTSRRTPNLLVQSQEAPSDNIRVTESTFYHRPDIPGINVDLGDNEHRNRSLTVTNNVIAGGLRPLYVKNWDRATVTRNLIHARHTTRRASLVALRNATQSVGANARVTSNVRWNRNSYFDQSTAYPNPKPFFLNADPARERDKGMNFYSWRRDTGFDGDSSYVRSRPRGTEVRVLRDEFESGRAILTVLNWAERLTVQADLEEAGIKPGSVYEIRDAQNPLAPPLLRGSYSGGTVDIPMTMREVQQPIGHPNVTHTPIEFGVFMVRAIQS